MARVRFGIIIIMIIVVVLYVWLMLIFLIDTFYFCALCFNYLACNCFMFGIINNGSCNQTTGQCACKQNVTGRQCDKCEDTFWGFHLPPEGDCRGESFTLT